jgi:tetratricopeptide (TPR) repeat protein
MSDDHERSIGEKQILLGSKIKQAYELMGDDKDEEAADLWAEIAEEIWPVIDGVIAELGMDKKPTEDKVDRSYDKEYDLNNVLADADMALANSGRNEERLRFNRRLLETFDTSKEDYQYSSAKQAIAESLNGLGRYEECDAFLKEWKEEDPDEVYSDFVGLRCMYERKQDPEKLKKLCDLYMGRKNFNAPSEDVRSLYEMIAIIYGELGEEELQKKAEERMNG